MNRSGEALCAALSEGPAGFDFDGLTPDDWREVAALAIRQRVGPLLFSRSHIPFPEEVRTTLRARAALSARRCLLQQAAFRELAAAVEPQAIPLMALKGLHLATSVYPNAALREMNDIDVLVRPEHVEPVSSAARRLGYRPVVEFPVARAIGAMHHVPRFLNGKVGLEVHWRLATPGAPPRVEPDDLWTVAEPSPLSGHARQLSPEALLVHVCAHAGSHHLEQGIRPLCDVQAIITRFAGTLSWPLIVELARQWQCERSVALVLLLAQSTLGVAVRDDLPGALSIRRPSSSMLELAITQMLSETRDIYETSPAAGELLSTRGLWAKWGHLRERIWLPPHLMEAQYPDAGTGRLARAGIPARRLFDMIRRHAFGLLRLASRRTGVARAALDRRNVLIAWLRER